MKHFLPELILPKQNTRERSRDAMRSRLAAAIALLISGTAVFSANQKIEEGYESRRSHESKLFEDDVELPITKSDLQRLVLQQAGVRTIEEFARNPEAVKKIDLGLFFLQTEFLENKISAREAVRAWKILQFKRQVFKKLAQELPDKKEFYQAILNEIVDPQIFLEPVPLRKRSSTQDDDYESGQALLSGALLNGKSNCYGSSRLFIAIASHVFPQENFKLHVPPEHVRTVISIDGEDWAAEPGLVLAPIEKEELPGTVMYGSAARAYLHEYGVRSPVIKYEGVGKGGGSLENIPITISRAFTYKNTTGASFFQGDFFDETPSWALPANIPNVADRTRVSYRPTEDWSWKTSDIAVLEAERNKIERPDAHKTVEQLIGKTLADVRKAENEHVQEEYAKQVSKPVTNIKPETGAAKQTVAEKSVQEKGVKRPEMLLYGAQYSIPRLLRTIKADPTRRAAYEKVIIETLLELRDAGLIENLLSTNERHVAGLMRDAHSEYAQSYRDLNAYVRRWESGVLHKDEQIQTKALELVSSNFGKGVIDFSVAYGDLRGLLDPDLHPYIPKYKTFLNIEKAKQLLRAIDQQVDVRPKTIDLHMMSKIQPYFADNEFVQLFNVVVKKINLEDVRIVGSLDENISVLQKIIEAGKRPRIEWMLARAGDISALKPFVDSDLIDLFFESNVSDEQPPYIDKERLQIVIPENFEAAKQLGSKYRADLIYHRIIFDTRIGANPQIGFGEYGDLSSDDWEALAGRLRRRGIKRVPIFRVENTPDASWLGGDLWQPTADKDGRFFIDTTQISIPDISSSVKNLKKIVISGKEVTFLEWPESKLAASSQISPQPDIYFDHVGNIRNIKIPEKWRQNVIIEDDLDTILDLLRQLLEKSSDGINEIDIESAKNGQLSFSISHQSGNQGAARMVNEPLFVITDYHSLIAFKLLCSKDGALKGMQNFNIKFAFEVNGSDEYSDFLNVKGYFKSEKARVNTEPTSAMYIDSFGTLRLRAFH